MQNSKKLRGLFVAFSAALSLAASVAEAAPFRIIITETETPLVPNSVTDLALRLGYYKKAGVEVELVRVAQTPSAVAALRSGQGEMANLALDSALQLVARNQMKLKGVMSPDKALPFVIATSKDITSAAQLEGKAFGVARVGSVDYLLSRTVLAKLGLNPDKVNYVALGQPPVRAQSLLAKRIDATTFSIGVWLNLADKSGVNMLVDQQKFNDAAPFITKLNVVTETTASTRGKEVQAVVDAIIAASRDFAKDPKIWVDAMVQARPDVKRTDLEQLAENYKANWSINGGLNMAALSYTTDTIYLDTEWKDVRKVDPKEWIDLGYTDRFLAANGVAPTYDATGR